MAIKNMVETNYFSLTHALCFVALILYSKFELGVCFPSPSRQTSENDGYRFTIDAPTFEWSGFRLEIDYKLSAPITDEIVTYAIVSDTDCDGGKIADTEIESSLIQVSDNSVRLSLLFNPENIHGARYVTHQENFAIVGICARLYINGASESPENEIEVGIVSAPRDDYVIIEADLEDLKGITDILDDDSLLWGVDVFQCNYYNEVVSPVPALKNGEKLRLCLKPTSRTREFGVYLSFIKSFRFARDGVIQEAVATYGTDEVTNVECYRGSDLCVIESVLSNDFFQSPGEVKAEGMVYLQYGYKEKRKHRSLRSVQINLRSSTYTRSLYDYEVGEVVGEKPAEYVVKVEPIDKVFSAEAFSCDSNNNLVKKKTLVEGDHMKLCIQPDKEATSAGVYINSIESFSFGRANDDKIQIVVDSYGRVTNDNRTQVECTSGVTKCSINSTLEDWFFDDDASIVVTGFVILQFGVNNQRRRAHIVYRDLVESSDSDLGFAGRSQVDAYFDTVGRNIDEKKGPFENLFDEWNLSDTHMTILYIVAAVLFILICLCCCAGLLFLCYVTKEKEPVPKSRSQMPIIIKIQEKDNSNSTDVRAGSNSRDDDYDSDDSSNDDSEDSFTGSPNTIAKKSVAKKKKKIEEEIDSTRGKIGEDNTSATPGENDICFEAKEHPGTESFMAAVQQTLNNLGPVPYSPAVYKNIKRQLSNRRFYSCDQDNDKKNDDDGTDNQYEWREASKRELIDIFWKHYEEEKSQML